jgi:hypothetical protein
MWISPPWGLDADHEGPVYAISESGPSFQINIAKNPETSLHSEEESPPAEAASTEAR